MPSRIQKKALRTNPLTDVRHDGATGRFHYPIAPFGRRPCPNTEMRPRSLHAELVLPMARFDAIEAMMDPCVYYYPGKDSTRSTTLTLYWLNT